MFTASTASTASGTAKKVARARKEQQQPTRERSTATVVEAPQHHRRHNCDIFHEETSNRGAHFLETPYPREVNTCSLTEV